MWKMNKELAIEPCFHPRVFSNKLYQPTDQPLTFDQEMNEQRKTELDEFTGVWFIYDGDCPICTRAADALRIKQKFGALSTLNARENDDHPLVEEISRQGLDLDEGMVIYHDGDLHHGKDALRFMAKHGRPENGLMAACKSLFWSAGLARLMYPWMKGCRNWLLKRKNAGRIDNLNLKDEPIFKSVFGDDWDTLPPVMKKHYANRPYTDEVYTIDGVLHLYCKPPLLWLGPLINLMGQVPILNKNEVPVTVNFESDKHSKAFHFKRIFKFPGRKPHVFNSRMFHLKDNQVAEHMKYGLVWISTYLWDGEKIVLDHKGYALKLFGHFIPLPLTLLIGAGSAVEKPIDDRTFSMETWIKHPWWGEMYGYRGRFTLTENTASE